MPPQPSNEQKLYTPVAASHDAIQVAWCYPAPRNIAMSSLGYLSLFRQLDEAPNVYAERVYADTVKQANIRNAELMGFSFAFELDAVEILRMLDGLGVPLWQRDRTDEPLVFAGGPTVMTNPEPYAEFFDFFLVGEGEGMLAETISAMVQVRHLSRDEQLRYLAKHVAGCYVPSLYEATYDGEQFMGLVPIADEAPAIIQKQALSREAMANTIATSPILSEDSVFGNTYLIEVMRGCSHKCRFCMASYAMLPARGSSAETILNAVDTGLQHTNKLGLLGALIADHPQFGEICDGLHQRMDANEDIRLNAAALRVDRLSERIVETFIRGGQQQLTVAIESGSERLRHRINKHLKQAKIHEAMETVSQTGLKGLKFYGMVGLPDETDDDIEETIQLLAQVKKDHPKLKLVLGCSTFVPKGGTPFQWMARLDKSRLAKRQKRLEKGLLKIADFRPSSPRWDDVQAILARGDRRMSVLVERYYQLNKDAEGMGSAGALKKADRKLRDEGLAQYPSLDDLLHKPFAEGDTLPWEHINLGVDKAMLWKESLPPVMLSH